MIKWVHPKEVRMVQYSQINKHNTSHKEQQRQPRASRRKEITEIRAELNDIETKSTILRINKSRSWLLENIRKLDKPLTIFIKKKETGPK